MLHLSCSTSRLRSTLWITKFCWSGCVLPSVTISCMVSVLSRWTHARTDDVLPTSSVVCHKDRSSDRSFSLFIPLIWRRSLLNTDCRYTSMPMTVKDNMVPASLMPHLLCRATSQNALMTCTAGCGQTGCNLTVRRQK